MSEAELIVWEWRVALVLFGAAIGSFLNVVIHRVPRGESVVRPRSRCPHCGGEITALQNIPVFSWALLGGKCARCRAPISWRYPLVELLNAALWLAVGVRFHPSLQSLLLLPLVSALIALFFTDLDEMLLPDKITLPLFVMGLISAPWNRLLDFAPGFLGSGTVAGRLAHSAAGAALGYGLFLAIAMGGKLLFRKEAMGGGDLKLMLGVGAYLGFTGVVITLFAGSMLGALYAIPLLIRRRLGFGHELPFGCFLVPAALISLFFGVEIGRWYLGKIFPLA